MNRFHLQPGVPAALVGWRSGVRTALAALVLASVACTTTEPAITGRPAPNDNDPGAAKAAQIAQAVASPLTDLNLVRAEIPPVLAAAMRTPYAAPASPGCAALADEVQALDAALGADLDVPASAAQPSLIERGANAAADSAVGTVRSTTEGLVPFRGWVRRLSGAERYAREVAAAIAAGAVRRAYLKGLGQAGGCAVPAAPRAAGSGPFERASQA